MFYASGLGDFMTVCDEHAKRVSNNIAQMTNDKAFQGLSNIWLREGVRYEYPLNFSWLGRPYIQIPQDIYALQEIIWQVKPDLIIETGIAHGGSLMMSASMLALLDYCDAVESCQYIDPLQTKRLVLAVDIDIRSHNRSAIEAHPMRHLIKMIQGSSIASDIVERVKSIAKDYSKILVCLDSNHTHDHVLAELEAYAPLTSRGSYCIVWDTGIEDMPADFSKDRPWGKGNNPKTAVREYLCSLASVARVGADGTALNFAIDHLIENKIVITGAPDGFLRRN